MSVGEGLLGPHNYAWEFALWREATSSWIMPYTVCAVFVIAGNFVHSL